MKGTNRRHLINSLIQDKGYESYLEIGCHLNDTFSRVNAKLKIGVDPQRGGNRRMTSDAFFAQNDQVFDIVFVDGLHYSVQVVKDVNNSLNFLNPNGVIILHDCLPESREMQAWPRPSNASSWSGDVWKAVVGFRQRPDLDTAVWEADRGLGAIVVRPNADPIAVEDKLNWESYLKNRDRWLRVMSTSEMENFLDINLLRTD